MSTNSNTSVSDRVREELILPIKPRYGALIGWGIFSIVLGTVGLIVPVAFSIGVTIFIGAILLAAGATGLALFWKAQGWGARTAAVLSSLLSAVTGLLLIFYPLAGTESLTLFLASYFIAIGLLKVWVSVTNRDTQGWWLMLFSALISVLLGGCLWWGWPQSAPYIFGIFVAIEMLFDGWTAFMFGLEVRSFVKEEEKGKEAENAA
jgi:uncharacterized membrane protein HdeD (DUF308 family)